MRIWRAEFLWLALVAILMVMAVWWFPGTSSLKTDSYSVSFSGKKALYQTLRRLERDVSRSLENLVPRPGFGDRLLILGPARSPSAEEWDMLYREVLDGGSLVFVASARDPYLEADVFGARVVPFWDKSATEIDDELFSDGARSKSDESVDSDSAGDGDRLISNDDDGESKTDQSEDGDGSKNKSLFSLKKLSAETDLVEGHVDWKTQARIDLDASDWEVLVAADSKPQVVRRQVGAGTVVLVASDDIFSNQALTEPNRALLAYRIIKSAPSMGQTWFDESLNSSGVPKVLGILFDPAFRPMTLQLVLIAVLFGWSASRRFGPADPPTTPRRRSIVEHAEAVGILYFRAGAGAHAVRSQVEFLKHELRRLYGTTFRVENADALSRQAGLDEGKINDLLHQENISSVARLSNPAAGRLLRGLAELFSRIRADSGRHSS